VTIEAQTNTNAHFIVSNVVLALMAALNELLHDKTIRSKGNKQLAETKSRKFLLLFLLSRSFSFPFMSFIYYRLIAMAFNLGWENVKLVSRADPRSLVSYYVQ
jgi:hypothetical protein